MNRRTFLHSSGVTLGVVGFLGGCTDQTLEEAEREPSVFDDFHAEEEASLPVPQKLGIAADGLQVAGDAEVSDLDSFEAFLEEEGFEIEILEERVEDGEAIVSLEYVVSETVVQGLVHHLGIVAGGYAELVAAGHESEKLDVSLLQLDGTTFGEYEVRRRWAEEYKEGDLSAREYAGEVLEGAQST